MGLVSRIMSTWRTPGRVAHGAGRPIHEAAGSGRRSLAWRPGNPGAMAALFATGHDLRVKSRDLVRRNAWAGSAVDAFVNLTVADGAADFVVGDTFVVEVSGDGKVVGLDPTAVDGTAEAIGIVAYDVTAPDGADTEVTAILRDAVLADRAIVWPAGITEARKKAAIAELEARGILVRKAA